MCKAIIFFGIFLQIIYVNVQGCPPITPRGLKGGESPRAHDWVVFTVLVVSSTEYLLSNSRTKTVVIQTRSLSDYITNTLS